MRMAPMLVLAACLGIWACSSASPEQVQKAEAAKLLSGEEIKSTIVGNTISGQSRKGPTYVEYYQANGTIRGLWAGKDKYVGKWSIADNQMCWDYDGSEDDGCGGIKLDGRVVYYTDKSGKVGNAAKPAQLSAGNPQGL